MEKALGFKDLSLVSVKRQVTVQTSYPISAEREAPDAVSGDEGIASAISEEKSAADEVSQATEN